MANMVSRGSAGFDVGKMLQAAEHWPVNFGFLGRGNTSRPRSILDQITGGCIGLKIHEDWGRCRR
jgi:urease subunit alpha